MAENQVKVNQADTVPNYLYPKLQAGHGISLRNNGSSIRIDALGNPGDRKVLVDSSDQTPGFLADKIEAGTGVTLNNTGSAIEINANTQTGDHKVIITSADSSPDYLDEKIKAGTNVTITNQGTYLEISSTDTGMLNPMTSAGDLIVGGASGDPDRLGVGTNGQVLTVTSGAPAWASIPTQTGDHKVLATSADTSPNYLDQKIAGSGVVSVSGNTSSVSVGIDPSSTDGQVLTTDNGAVAWKTIPTQTGDHKVIINSSDTSPDYLASKLIQGTGITLTSGANAITIAADTQTGDHKVLADSTDVTPSYLSSKIVVGSGLVQSVVTPFADFNKVRIALDTAGASSGQILSYDGANVAWTNQVQIPKRIDWTVETAFINGTFNQTLDRTFYVEMFPECEFKIIDAMVAVLDSSNSGDEWRVAVFDNTRTMTYYGTSTGTSQNFRKFTSLTKLAVHTFDANNVYYLAISQHTAGNSSSKLKTASVTSPVYCWYEDVALTSGRAMPATSSLTAVSGKVPAIGLRGR